MMIGIISVSRAFVTSRQILNGILITNECIGDGLNQGNNGIFLDYILGRMDFGDKWRWIRLCIGFVLLRCY